MSESTLTALTSEEVQAGLSLEQLKQLVGLVEYDATNDPFPVVAQDAVCFVVGNATQTAAYYQLALGMELEAYRGPENGFRDAKSYVLRSGSARFVFTGGGHPRQPGPRAPPPARRRRRGPGHRGDRRRQVHRARPLDGRDGPGRAARRVRRARHRPAGRHRDVRRDPAHAGRPQQLRRPLPARLRRADQHRASAARATRSGCSRPSTTASATSSSAGWTSGSTFYNRVMGFTNMAEFVGDDIATDYSALMSKVVASGNHRVKFPLNEPAIAKKKSQIDEYLEFYDGAGCQHIALATNDILRVGRHPARQRHRVPRHPRLLLRRPRAARPDRRGAGPDRGAEEAQDPGRPRRGRLPAADLHQADGGPADGVLRVHRAARLAGLRQGQLQGALRGDRARAGGCVGTL